MAESKEEIKNLLMKVKEESEKVSLTLKKARLWHLQVWLRKTCGGLTLTPKATVDLQLATSSLPCLWSTCFPISTSYMARKDGETWK